MAVSTSLNVEKKLSIA